MHLYYQFNTVPVLSAGTTKKTKEINRIQKEFAQK